MTLSALTSLIIACPKCGAGSSDMIESIRLAGLWGHVICHACNERFEIATAIDEMFVASPTSSCIHWTGGKQIYRPLSVTSGHTHLIDIKGIFDEVYLVTPFFQRIEWLAGGYHAKHIPQGYVMISIAPNPDGKVTTLQGGFFIEGRPSNQPELRPWEKMLLRAKLSIYESPDLTIILSLNAVDLYLEELTGMEVGAGRPGAWSNLIKEHFNKRLKQIADIKMVNVEKFVQLRNSIAHGRNYHSILAGELKQAEENWLKEGKYMEGVSAFSPSAGFALRTALTITRACRRFTDNGKFVPVYKSS